MFREGLHGFGGFSFSSRRHCNERSNPKVNGIKTDIHTDGLSFPKLGTLRINRGVGVEDSYSTIEVNMDLMRTKCGVEADLRWTLDYSLRLNSLRIEI